MYLAINQTSKEFALLSHHSIANVESLQEQYLCADIVYKDVDEIANLRLTVNYYIAKGYKRAAIDSYNDLLYFTIL